MEEKKKTKTDKKKRGRLTLYAYLLHLRHLGDGLLQVFQELEQLLSALGAEVEHLLPIRAERREDGDAVWVVCRQDMRQSVGQSVRRSVAQSVSRPIVCKRRRLTLVFKEVELHAQQAHGFAEGVRRRTLLLWTELQDL